MKVVAFNGSPRRNGNTSMLIKTVIEVLEGQGIETETVQLGGQPVRGCVACYKCFENKDRHCAQTKDLLTDLLRLHDSGDQGAHRPGRNGVAGQ